MTSTSWSVKAEAYLRRLCLEVPDRRVGGKGNREATDFFANVVSSLGFDTESPPFDCIDWTADAASLTVDGASFEVFASPYSLGCCVHAPLVVVSTVEDLEAADLSNSIVLLRGDIAREQIMPKSFSFYNPDSHKRIIQLLEAKRPLAIVAATNKDPEMVGAQYPFPLIEDGDFDIPSVFMTGEEGNSLAEHAGREIRVESSAHRIPASGCNVIARKGANPDRRVVLFAHIDAKPGIPGACDNAAGVVVLLLLAELLADYSGDLCFEIVALNGEDYYSNPGEQQYLSANAGKFSEIVLGINIDGAGYRLGKTAYSLYDCPSLLANTIHQVLTGYAGMIEGPPWYQSDHSLFLINQRPAVAITSERAMELFTEVTHTPKDSPELVDSAKLVEVAIALRDLVLCLAGQRL